MTIRVRTIPTDRLAIDETAEIRELMAAAFGDEEDERFTDEDWEHALGGRHVLLDEAGRILSHAAVVTRTLHVAGRPVRTGYVEAVATLPGHQGQGHGTRVMIEIDRIIDDDFELGALGTGSHGFYERLGWHTWRGPSAVRTADGEQLTPDDDGYIMVRRTATTPAWVPGDRDIAIVCEWRPGDVW